MVKVKQSLSDCHEHQVKMEDYKVVIPEDIKEISKSSDKKMKKQIKKVKSRLQKRIRKQNKE